MVKVTMLEGETPRRMGFLAGQYSIPDDFDSMAADEIRGLFEGDADAGPDQTAQ
ncbi:hypothetical protein [Paracoccus cavernae]|uniref:hypothetical protein n=1 Tax=Paracoccus cavernae TaxID=1571207 RepID=UPI00363E33E7